MRPVVYVLRDVGDGTVGERIQGVLDNLARPKSHDRTLLKPNLLRQGHILREHEHEQVITQRQVIEPVARWVRNAVDPDLFVIADAPEASADIDLVLQRNGVADLLKDASIGIDRFEDLRLVRYIQRDGVPLARVNLPGDSAGTIAVKMDDLSAFVSHGEHRYYGADYDIAETNARHKDHVHEYMFSGTALASDFIINLPKMKTHKKAGVTLSHKNLVGLNGNKNWLPHHSIGTPSQGGDAYAAHSLRARIESAALNRLKPLVRRTRLASTLFSSLRRGGAVVFGDTQETVRSGNWHGNDTIWRMILDLNRILLYARSDGVLMDTPQRTAWSVVDGIVAGDGNGPEAPDAVDAGLVVIGEDFASVDLTCTKLMGFAWEKIPHLAHLFDDHPLPLVRYGYNEITVQSDVKEWNRPLSDIDRESCLTFQPHFGWRGQIEL